MKRLIVPVFSAMCCFLSNAYAASAQQIADAMVVLVGAHIKIKDTRTIYVWYAVTNEIPACWIVYAPATLATLNQKAYELKDFTVTQAGIGIAMDENSCYLAKP